MKNRIVFLFFSFLVVFVACNSEEKSSEKPEEKRSLTIEEPSELANLMKGMKKQSLSIKEAIQLGDSINFELLEEWKKIHSATPTEKDKKTPIYYGFADAFLMAVDSLKSAKNNIENFNIMVTACVNCHRELCPGPVATIEKLKLKQ